MTEAKIFSKREGQRLILKSCTLKNLTDNKQSFAPNFFRNETGSSDYRGHRSNFSDEAVVLRIQTSITTPFKKTLSFS